MHKNGLPSRRPPRARKAIPAYLLPLILLLGARELPAAQNVAIDSLILSGIVATIEQDFDRAYEIFGQVVTDFPDSPAGHFYMAAAIQSQMFDWENFEREEEFYRHLHRATEQARRCARSDPRDAWAYFYLGSAYTYDAYYVSRKKHYLKAFNLALQAEKNLKKAVALDSTLYDAYYGLGAFKYWRSRMTSFLRWLPMFPNDEEEGIRMIETAVKKSRITQYPALNGLTWILMDVGRMEEAKALAERGHQSHPRSRFFLWPTAEVHFRAKQWSEALPYYRQILRSLEDDTYPHPYNRAHCKLKMARCLFSMERYDEALAICRDALDSSHAEKPKGRLGKKLARLKKLARECEVRVAEGDSKYGQVSLGSDR